MLIWFIRIQQLSSQEKFYYHDGTFLRPQRRIHFPTPKGGSQTKQPRSQCKIWESREGEGGDELTQDENGEEVEEAAEVEHVQGPAPETKDQATSNHKGHQDQPPTNTQKTNQA